jgi:hypothetical protein
MHVIAAQGVQLEGFEHVSAEVPAATRLSFRHHWPSCGPLLDEDEHETFVSSFALSRLVMRGAHAIAERGSESVDDLAEKEKDRQMPKQFGMQSDLAFCIRDGLDQRFLMPPPQNDRDLNLGVTIEFSEPAAVRNIYPSLSEMNARSLSASRFANRALSSTEKSESVLFPETSYRLPFLFNSGFQNLNSSKVLGLAEALLFPFGQAF